MFLDDYISFKKHFNHTYFTCVCLCMVKVPTSRNVWRSENNYQESVLAFHHMGLRDQTLIPMLGSKCFYQLSHLTSPIYFTSNKGLPGT